MNYLKSTRHFCGLCLFALIMAFHALVQAQVKTNLPSDSSFYTINVAGKGIKPDYNKLKSWGGVDNKGNVIRANDYYFELNGKPFAIVGGDFQPQRYPVEEWEDAIVKMKAGGLNFISSCIFWTLFEPEPGKFNFTGRNNIKYFAELCKKHGMYVFLRPGPFNNAEMLVGGLPPWHFGMVHTERSNEEGYLKYVTRYYNKLGEHLKGDFWKQGGSIIALQPENELSHAPNNWDKLFEYGVANTYTGPTGDGYTNHYYNLRDIARNAGMETPIYSITAWGTAGPLPTKEFMLTYGAYMYLRAPGAKNNQLTLFHPQPAKMPDRVPRGYCEIGSGTPVRLSLRPDISPESCLADALSVFGAMETTMMNYYLFTGGTNPLHPVYGFMTKWPGLPLMSYDFMAPVSEYGVLRPSYYALRPLNMFLKNYADSYANQEVAFADSVIKDYDTDKLRVIAKSNNDGGFIFATNYGNVNPLSDRPDVRIKIKTSVSDIIIPRKATLNIHSADFAVMPFNYTLSNGVKLISATAWPFNKIERADEEWLFFHDISGSDAEFVLDLSQVKQVEHTGGSKIDTDIWLLKAGRNTALVVTALNNKKVHLVLLTKKDAEHIAEVNIKGNKYLALSDNHVMQVTGGLKVTGVGKNELDLSVFPAILKLKTSGYPVKGIQDGFFTKYNVKVPEKHPQVKIDSINSEKTRVKMNENEFAGLENIYLNISYAGDVCRIFDIREGMIKGDDLNSEKPWSISLKRFRKQLNEDGILLRVGPKVVGVNSKVTGSLIDIQSKLSDEKPDIKNIEVVPVYKTVFSW